MIEAQQTAQSGGTDDFGVWTWLFHDSGIGKRDDVRKPLMVAFLMVVLDILIQDVTKLAFTHKNQVVETFGFHRFHPAKRQKGSAHVLWILWFDLTKSWW